MVKIILSCIIALSSVSLFAQIPQGDWAGQISVQGMKLGIVFHVAKTDDGFESTMDSPDQQAYGIEMSSTTYTNDTLYISHDQGGMTFKATFEGDSVLIGNISQSGMVFPLRLSQNETPKPVGPNRPQHPSEPFSYSTEEIIVLNKKASVELSGTLSYPKESGKYPLVILISGSGPQDRDETIMSHKPFLVISDHFVKQGIAVYRFDDRGVGPDLSDDFNINFEASLNF